MRVRCRHKESSCSLSHLLVSFLLPTVLSWQPWKWRSKSRCALTIVVYHVCLVNKDSHTCLLYYTLLSEPTGPTRLRQDATIPCPRRLLICWALGAVDLVCRRDIRRRIMTSSAPSWVANVTWSSRRLSRSVSVTRDAVHELVVRTATTIDIRCWENIGRYISTLRWAVLTDLWIGFCLTGPFHCA